MTKLFKSTALALAASSVALTAVPAQAQRGYDRYDRYNQRGVFECGARANGGVTDFDVDRRY